MSNTLRNETAPTQIASKGIIYANGDILYYKNSSGTVSQLNLPSLDKTTIQKTTDYTLTASDCNGTKTFVFNRFNELDYNPLVATLPSTAVNLAVKIQNRSNSTLLVRPPVGSTIYVNGKTYTNTSELPLNYFNQNVELLAIDSTTWVGLTNNSTEYEISKIIVNQLTYKCFILTTKGNLYFNGVNLDVSAGAFANFSDDIETTLATSKNVFVPIPQPMLGKLKGAYVVDFQYIYVSNTDETLYVLDSNGTIWTTGITNTSGKMGRTFSVGDGLRPVEANKSFNRIFAYNNLAFATTTDKELWAWGDNTNNRLGIDDGIGTSIATPRRVLDSTFCIRDITIGSNYAMALSEDGRVFSWGVGTNGQTGLARLTNPVTTMVQEHNKSSWRCVISGPLSDSSFGLKADGSLWSWGIGTSGVLGTNNTTSCFTHLSVVKPSTFNVLKVNKVSTGNTSTGILLEDGSAWTWGTGTNGTLGNNNGVTNYSTPVAVCGGHTFCQISVGNGFMIALKHDGSVWSWGFGSNGVLGDNTISNKSTPVAVCGNHTFCQISAGDYHVLALKADGSAWAWGLNTGGSLGNNSGTASFLTPVAVCGNHTFCSIHASGGNGGIGSSFGLKSDGSLWSWGWGGERKLGDGFFNARSTPVAVCGGHTFCQVASTRLTTHALKADGSLWVWGTNTYGLSGNFDATTSCFSTPVAVCRNHTFCQISGGGNHILALDSTGTLWSWGDNTYGQLGINKTVSASSIIPQSVEYFYNLRISICQIFINPSTTNTSFALSEDGRMFSWGLATAGILGDNSTTNKSTPVAVCGSHTFCSIVQTETGTAGAIRNDGTVWLWGIGTAGQLGNGTSTSVLTPSSVCGINSICEVKSTSTNFYARQANGTLWSWGNYNSTTIFGKLGNGTFSNTTLVPVPVCAIPNETVCKIFAYPNIGLTTSMNSPIVYTRNNKLFMWGSNIKNIVGVKGSYLPSLCARSVSLGYSVRDIMYGYPLANSGTMENIAILRTDGSVWTWGRPDNGRLGDGTTTSKNSPVSVCGNHTFCSIYTTGFTTTISFGGLKADGSAWAWGDNASGQLGDNSTTNRCTPVAVCGGHTFCQINGNRETTVALKSNGSAWGWGVNTAGVLGDNTITARATPVAVCGGHTFCQIGVGTFFTVALKSDGSAWAWGINSNGQLGDNSVTSRITPVAVCGGHTFCSIYVSTNYTVALKSDGSAWGWGTNTVGILGDNTTTNRSTPVAVCGGYTFCSVLVHKNNLKQISTTQPPTMIMKDVNNNIYMWGYGTFEYNYGRGVKLYFMSTTESSRTPTKIYNSFLASVCSIYLGRKYDSGGGLNFSKYSLLKGNDGNYYYWGFVEGLIGDNMALPNSLLFNEPKYILTPQEITKFYEVY